MTGIAIIGANGQLGSDLVRVFRDTRDYEVVALSHDHIEVTDPRSIETALYGVRSDVIVNCAAFVRVDECEDRPEEAFRVNAIGALNLARISARLGTVCVYVSTDYVFDGAKGAPYTEEDSPFPLNVYGASKLAGEYFVRAQCPKHFVVRTAGLYGKAGSSGKQGNFVETVINIAKSRKPIRIVDDQVLTPTYTKDLAERIQELVETDAYGTYHMTSSGSCSWYDFGKKIFELVGLNPNFEPTSTVAFGAKARRPAYSVLACKKLTHLGLNDLRPWPEALEAYLQERGLLAS